MKNPPRHVFGASAHAQASILAGHCNRSCSPDERSDIRVLSEGPAYRSVHAGYRHPSLRAVQMRTRRLDCFVANAPRNDEVASCSKCGSENQKPHPEEARQRRLEGWATVTY